MKEGYPLGSTEFTPQEQEDLAWAEEADRNEVTTLNESLKQIITLASSILAGSAAFLAQSPLPVWSKGIGCASILLALIVALLGAMPQRHSVGATYLELIRAARERLASSKKAALTASGIFLVLGLGVFTVGLVYQAMVSLPPSIKAS